MIQKHPDYHLGFHEAQEGLGLFEGATAAYRAGWRAFWAAVALVSA